MSVTKGCTIEINGKTFSSDIELDTYLYEHRAQLERDYVKGAITSIFSLPLNRQEEVSAKLDEINGKNTLAKSAKDKAVGSSYLYKLVGLVSGESGTYDTPFVNYGSNKTISENPTDQFLNEDVVNSKTDKKSFGQFFHKMLEFAVDDVENLSAKHRSQLSQLYDYPKFGIEGDMLNAIYQIARGTVLRIKQQYPGCKFKKEFKFYAKQIDPSFLQAVRMHAHNYDRSRFPNEELITNVVAIADLIIITKDGDEIVLDWKTSSTPISRTVQLQPEKGFRTNDLRLDERADGTWSLAKRRDVSAQLALESIILEQNQIKPKTRIVVNFPVNLETNGKFINMAAPEFYRVPVEDLMSKMRVNFAMINTSTNGTFNEIDKEMGNIIPGGSVTSAEKDIEQRLQWYYDHFVKENTGSNQSKGKWVFFRSKMLGGGTIYAADKKTDMREDLIKYFEELDSTINSRYTTLADKLYEVIANNDVDELQSFLERYFNKNTNALLHLKKYVSDGWTLDMNQDAIVNGFFIFTKGDRSEIVIFTDDDPRRPIDLGKDRTSVLGLVKRDSEYGTDSRYILPAEHGRFLEIKAMSFISRNQDRFKSAPVSEIKVMTTSGNSVIHDDLWRLNQNWNELKHHFKHKKDESGNPIDLISINPQCFKEDGIAALLIAEDLVRTWGIKSKILENGLDEQNFNAEYIIGLIDNLISNHPRLREKNVSATPDAYSTEYVVLQQLLKAYSYFAGNKDFLGIVEEDVGPVFSGNSTGIERIIPDGTMTLSPNISKSANMRILGSIVGAWKTAVRRDLTEAAFRWQTLIAEIQEEGGYSSLRGGEFSWFENWFEKTDDHKIHPEFKLKDPKTDPYFKSRPAEKKACQYFLDYINSNRSLDPDDPDAYYRVPLVRAKGLERFMNLPFKEYVKERLEDLKDPFRDERSFDEDRVDETTNADGQFLKMVNPYDNLSKSDREKVIAKNGVEHYTTNMDIIFLQVLEWNLKCKYGEHFLPILNQMRMFISIENNINDAGMIELEKGMTKYIQSVIFNDNIVENTARTFQTFVSALKEMTTFLTLAGKTTVMIRDLLTNQIKLAKETFANNDEWNTRMAGFNKDLYIEAMIEAVHQGMTAGKIQSKSQQLNAIFGAFGFGFGQMSDSEKSNRYGIMNWDRSTAYWTSSAGDYLNRNAVLIMKLKSRGAYDAYIADEDGRYRYHMDKDPNYDIYCKYRENRERVTAEDRLKYEQQAQQYHDSINQWRSIGGKYAKLKYGDDLPEALDPKQQLSVLTQSDTLFGNFDKDTRATISRTLLGQMFMQFKTYGYASLLTHIKTAGAINVFERHIAQEINEKTGKLENICLVVNSPEEQQRTGQYFREVFESEVTEEMWKSGNVSYRMDTFGSPMEGKFQSWVAALAAVFHASDRDWKDIIDDPTKRFNLLSALFELLFSSIFSLMINKIYGEETLTNLTDEDWWTRWSYNVFNGVATDGPVWYTMESMFSEGTVPMVPILKRYFDNTLALVEGRSNVLQTLTKTFGATTELSSYFANN